MTGDVRLALARFKKLATDFLGMVNCRCAGLWPTAFVFWLALVIWNREAAAAAAS